MVAYVCDFLYRAVPDKGNVPPPRVDGLLPRASADPAGDPQVPQRR